MTGNDLHCSRCRREARSGPTYPPRCSCGGLWSVLDPAAYPTAEAGETGPGSPTPLWEDPVDPRLLWKREDLNRTGSFKDRGAGVLAAVARQAGARSLVVDSSGSAALAAASAGARIGLPVTVHTPAALTQGKREALDVLGARVVAEGSREEAATRAQRDAQDAFYFSHVHHPAFLEGTAGAGFEVLQQVRGTYPGTWIVPVGNGSLLLGLALALGRLGKRGVRLVAVQAAACPGLNRPGRGGGSAAHGIAIADPPRREQILEAVGRSLGEVIEVEEEEIETAWRALWRRGVAAERASAAALAGAERLRAAGESGTILGWLTGSGHRDGSGSRL